MDTTDPRPTVVAIYYPAWHPYPHMSAWKGDQWVEWELVRNAPARFRGHQQPLRPSWGYFDESNPRWAAREIDLAADHGIDVFLFDWYWYSGVRIMEEALERGFLRSPNRRRLKFALMWANHDWANIMPAPFGQPAPIWLPTRASARDFQRLIDYGITHYFHQPNYWRLNDELFFSVFQPRLFIEQLGGPQKTRRLLGALDRRLHAAGLPSMHWNGMTWTAQDLPVLTAAGFDTSATYAKTFGLTTRQAVRSRDTLREAYPAVMENHRRHWQLMAAGTLPHLPVVTMGGDITPRCRADVRWPFPPAKGQKRRAYPYLHVVVGNTPQRFETLCRAARTHLAQTNTRHRVVFVNAWNEWTEGSYLLPEKRHGTAYLKAIQRAFGRELR